MRLSCTFYDIASCFSKVVDFTYPVCIQSIFISREPKPVMSRLNTCKKKKTNTTLQPPLGGDPVEFKDDLWRQKIRDPYGLSCGVVCVILRSSVLIQ